MRLFGTSNRDPAKNWAGGGESDSPQKYSVACCAVVEIWGGRDDDIEREYVRSMQRLQVNSSIYTGFLFYREKEPCAQVVVVARRHQWKTKTDIC